MTAAVVLAAGQGKRMHSDLPKVMHPVLGRPMILRVLESARRAGLDDVVVVAGHGRELLIPLLEEAGFRWVVQEPQLGTAHAVQCALDAVDSEELAVLLGDVPLLEPDTIRDLVESRRREEASIAVLTTRPPDVSGYGRVLRTEGSRIGLIVEERDATPAQLRTREINTGLMVFDGTLVRDLIGGVGNDNSQGEYYLTDCIAAAVSMGLTAVAVEAPDWSEVAGINDPEQLSLATRRLLESVVAGHIRRGVRIPDPGTVWIEETVTIGPGTVVAGGCRLTGTTSVGSGCSLGEGCLLSDADVPAGTVLEAGSVVGRSA